MEPTHDRRRWRHQRNQEARCLLSRNKLQSLRQDKTLRILPERSYVAPQSSHPIAEFSPRTKTTPDLFSYAGDAKHTIQQGPMCWSGGFLHLNTTVVSFNIAGKEYGIKMECRFWKIHSKKCGMSDFSWLAVIIGAPIALLVLVGSVISYRNRARRAQYALAT
jgi:hypothetical protein